MDIHIIKLIKRNQIMLNINSLIFYSLSPHSPPLVKGLFILFMSNPSLGAFNLKGHKNLIT